MIKDLSYNDITLEEILELNSKGFIVTCDGDGWAISIKPEN